MNVECAAYHEQSHATQAEDFGPRVRSGMEMGMLIPATKYLQAQRLRRKFRQDMIQMAGQVDVVLTPAIPAPAPRDRNTTGDASFQVPWTTSGLPTVTLPSGLSEDGLPLAVQLGALPLEEDRKSTRLNSSHKPISYAVFCLKKKTHITHDIYSKVSNLLTNSNTAINYFN